MAKVFRNRLSWLIVPASLVCLALAASYVLGQQANRNREIEIELGAEVKDPITELFDEAQHLRTHGKEAEALAAFEQILVKHPDAPIKPMVYFYMGSCHVALKQPQRAIALYQQILAENPDFEHAPATWFALALAYRVSDEKKQSLDSLGQIVRQWPHSRWAGHATCVRATLLSDVGRDEDAIRELTEFVADAASRTKHWKGIALDTLARLYAKQGKHDLAIDALIQRRAQFGENEEVLFQLARLYDHTEQFALAVATAQELLTKHPKYHNRAMVEKILGVQQ